MEKQLFDYLGRGGNTRRETIYCDCMLKVAIGEYPVGTRVEYIVINWCDGTLSFHAFNGSKSYFKTVIHLAV